MKIRELFSKRQKCLRGEVPDMYEYETIPPKLRVQVVYIWEDIWGEVGSRNFRQFGSPLHAYESIHKVLGREYGVFKLNRGSDYDESVLNFFLRTEETEKVIDVIEVSFRYIDQRVRNNLNAFLKTRSSYYLKRPRLSPDEAINELNYRFREHGVGYQYASGQMIKEDSRFVHSEVVKPTLSFLSDPIYEGANEEFLNAHEHYRKGRYKECLNDCLKAFESCLKIICQKRGWHYNKKDTANRLIETVFEHELIGPSMICHFTSLSNALKNALKSGVPTVRNDQSAHGQGPKEITVPEYVVSYILHLTASNILLLAKADEEMK